KVQVRALSHIDQDVMEKILALNVKRLEVYSTPPMITGSLVLDKVREERGREEDPALMEQMALIEVHKTLRPGDPPTQESARSLLNSFFFDPKRYDMGRVGRYKVNGKLGVNIPEHIHTLTLDDLL